MLMAKAEAFHLTPIDRSGEAEASETATMQDAMSLTRVIQLDATRQRRARLYESDRDRVEDCLNAAEGDVREALTAFGMQLDDALLDRFSRQAFDCGAAEWLERLASLTRREAKNAEEEGGDAGEGEEGKGGDEGEEGKSDAGDGSGSGNEASAVAHILEEVITLAVCGVDDTRSARRGHSARRCERRKRSFRGAAAPRVQSNGKRWNGMDGPAPRAQWGRLSTIKLIKKMWPEVNANAGTIRGWTLAHECSGWLAQGSVPRVEAHGR